MNQLLELEEQIKYGSEAIEYSKLHGVSFKNACAVIVDKYDLPITPKTLANNFAFVCSSDKVMGDQPASFKAYDPETIIRILEKKVANSEKKVKEYEDKKQFMLYQFDRLSEKMESISIPKFVKFPSNQSSDSCEIAMLDLSDLHIGKKVDIRDSAGICYYDEHVFEKQCGLLVNAVNEIIDTHRTGGSDARNLYINMLGDIVDGEMIYPGHKGEIDRQVSDQIFFLGEFFLSNVLVPLASMFEKVYIMAVDGNHGRVGGKKDGFDRKLNFDNILLRTWRSRLASYSDRVFFHISESPYMLYKVLGKLHLLTHATSGTARYPIASMERFLNGVSALNKKFIDFVHIAHFHKGMTFNFNMSELIVNGSWIGPDQFTVGKMQCGEYPFQRFYGVNSKHITWEYNIYLDDHIFYDPIGEVSYDVEVLTPTASDLSPIMIPDPVIQNKRARGLRKSFGNGLG